MKFYRCQLKQEGNILIYSYHPEAPPIGSIARENPPHPNVVAAKNRDHLEPASAEIFNRLQRTGLKDLSPAAMQKVELHNALDKAIYEATDPETNPELYWEVRTNILGAWT